MGRYHEIADSIRKKITNGTYKKSEKLPQQNEFMQEYQTSRVTIQKALTLLQRERVIYSKKGVGTFIHRDWSPYEYNGKVYEGFTKRLGKSGKVENRIISFSITKPNEQEQFFLNLTKDEDVYDFIRLRLLDDVPISLEYTIMPVSVIPNINETVLENSVYQYIIEDLQLEIGSSVRKVKADKSDQYDRDYLACKMDDPVLEIEQTVYLKNGKPFEYSQSRHRYDMGDFVIVNMK